MKTRHKPYLDAIHKKHPTLEGDVSAYTSGSQKSFDALNTEYIRSVETIDQVIRTISNIGSLAKMVPVTRDTTTGAYSPAPIKNIDFLLPNETDSSVDFLRKLFVNIFSQGAGLIVTEEGKRAQGRMINLYNIDVGRVEVVSDGTKLISEFQYKAEDGSTISYRAEDCIYINDSIDTSNLLYSLSRLKSLNDVILLQSGIVAQSKAKLTGGAKDSVIISSEAPISGRNMTNIKQAVDEFMQSATSSSLFMNAGLSVDTVGTSMSASDMLEYFTKLNTMIIRHFNIPGYLVGSDGGGANKSEEIRYSLRIFFTTTLKPVFRNIELQMTRFIRDVLGIKNIEMQFDLTDLDFLDESIDEKTDRALKLNKQGLISMNEARRMIEMAPIQEESANLHYFSAYLLGSAPISVENYSADLERYLNMQSVGAGGLPAGNAGGPDNTNLETGSQGGPTQGG